MNSEAACLEHLLTNVRQDGDCLLWAGAHSHRSGIPMVYFHGRGASARRLLLRLLLGEEEMKGKKVIAVCGARGCMNPAHLKPATQAQVVRHAHRVGRMRAGPDRWLRAMLASRGRIPVADRRLVLRMRAEGVTLQQIGGLYGATKAAVSMQIHRWNQRFGYL